MRLPKNPNPGVCPSNRVHPSTFKNKKHNRSSSFLNDPLKKWLPLSNKCEPFSSKLKKPSVQIENTQENIGENIGLNNNDAFSNTKQPVKETAFTIGSI